MESQDPLKVGWLAELKCEDVLEEVIDILGV